MIEDKFLAYCHYTRCVYEPERKLRLTSKTFTAGQVDRAPSETFTDEDADYSKWYHHKDSRNDETDGTVSTASFAKQPRMRSARVELAAVSGKLVQEIRAKCRAEVEQLRKSAELEKKKVAAMGKKHAAEIAAIRKQEREKAATIEGKREADLSDLSINNEDWSDISPPRSSRVHRRVAFDDPPVQRVLNFNSIFSTLLSFSVPGQLRKREERGSYN